MKQVIIFLILLAPIFVVAQQGRPQQQQIDPKKLTPGWHTDTTVIQINYKNLRYDPKGHVINKYYMLPSRKPINMSATLVDSTYKAVKEEEIANVVNN